MKDKDEYVKCEKCVYWVIVGDPKEALNECRKNPAPWTVTRGLAGCFSGKEKR